MANIGQIKKASEICTLYAVETVLIIFFPGGVSYYPCVDAAATKRLSCPEQTDAKREATRRELEKLKAENERIEKQNLFRSLMTRPLEDLSCNELLTLASLLKEKLKEMKSRVEFSAKTANSTASSSANCKEAINPSGSNPPGAGASADI